MDRNEIFERAADMGVKIKVATSAKQQNAIAIHLLEPDMYEIDKALDKCDRDGFEVIMLHTKLTWP